MEPRWDVILGAIKLFLCAILLRITYCIWTECNEHIVAFLATMKNISANNSPEENTWGMAAFGLVILSLLTAMKILTQFRE